MMGVSVKRSPARTRLSRAAEDCPGRPSGRPGGAAQDCASSGSKPIGAKLGSALGSAVAGPVATGTSTRTLTGHAGDFPPGQIVFDPGFNNYRADSVNWRYQFQMGPMAWSPDGKRLATASHFDIHTPLTSYHQHTRGEKADSLVSRMAAGQSIALVSDAGTPGISDPGADLISLAIAEGNSA